METNKIMYRPHEQMTNGHTETIEQSLPAETPEQITGPELKEKIFLSVVFDKLIDTFEDDLYDAGATDEDLHYFRTKVSKFSQEEILGLLSLPKDIRINLFEKAFTNSTGVPPVDTILQTALDGYHKYGFTLGYHVSSKEIVPSAKGWNITASEMDDRDDMKMAYYSVDYEHFYRKKPAKYIYFVRAETGANSSHKRDTSDRWSRAVELSIVDKVSLREVDELVNQIYKEKTKNAANAE